MLMGQFQDLSIEDPSKSWGNRIKQAKNLGEMEYNAGINLGEMEFIINNRLIIRDLCIIFVVKYE